MDPVKQTTSFHTAALLDNPRLYWAVQAALFAPMAVLWATVTAYRVGHSPALLTLVFTTPSLTLIATLGFPFAAAVLSTLRLLTGRVKNEIDWALSIGIIFLAICSIPVALRQLP